MFDKIKDAYRLQKQAKQIKEELSNIHIEAESEVSDQKVVVTVNGEMEVIKTEIPASLMLPELANQVGAAITKAANKAIKKAQQIAAEKMKVVMSEMQSLMGGGAAQS